MGFEHSIVNMYLFPSGLMMGGKFSIADYFIWNEIPTVIGNLVGGIAFVGLTLYSTHARTAPPQRAAKGVALAMADGISSSEVSHEASQYAAGGFLSDHYCTPDAWSVKTSVERVVAATNSWPHAQTQRSQYRYEQDRGYVCTFSALVLKSRTVHIFHVGDTRVYRLSGRELEQLTVDGSSAVIGLALLYVAYRLVDPVPPRRFAIAAGIAGTCTLALAAKHG